MTLSTLDRRTILKALTLAPAAALLPQALRAEAAGAGLITTDVCLVQPGLTEGPFYLDPRLVRSDITEGRAGLPMLMRLQVVDATCQPIAGARVDLWQCDAEGVYSGVDNLGDGPDTQGETFLRGTQMTDAGGLVEFRSVFPGWYRGRTTHIHYKVFLDDSTVLTSQLFFDEALTAAIYEDHEAYSDRAPYRDTRNDNDHIAQDAGDGAYATVMLDAPDGAAVAALVVGVDREARSGSLLNRLFGRG